LKNAVPQAGKIAGFTPCAIALLVFSGVLCGSAPLRSWVFFVFRDALP
jgi:hypothetical protein